MTSLPTGKDLNHRPFPTPYPRSPSIVRDVLAVTVSYVVSLDTSAGVPKNCWKSQDP